MNKRQILILNHISKYKRVDVSDLSDICKVSTVTIRKDLDYLESQNLLKREHGYALINNEDNINYRLAFDYDIKQQIAQKALKHILPNETIMIESGSTCTLLALEIAKRNYNNTIITNSVFIARYLANYPLTKIIVLGGEYQQTSEAMIGPLVKETLKVFNDCKLFIGTDGVDETFGFSSSDFARSLTVQEMARASSQLFVLTQSSKMHKHASFKLFDLDKADYIITDDYIQKEDMLMLELKSIKVE